MTLDAIKKSILSDAEAKASEIGSEATKEAHRIVKDAEERAKEIVRSAEQEAERETARLRQEAVAGAEMEASSMLLEARGEVVERVLKRVIDMVESELSKSSMQRILDMGVKQFRDVSSGEIVIRTSRKNAALLKGSKYEVVQDNVDGFMISTRDGKVALNATVGSIVERQADVARKLISDELFGERGRREAKAPVKRQRKAPKAKKAKERKKRKG